MYEDRTQKYNPEIHEEYIVGLHVHDSYDTFFSSTSLGYTHSPATYHL